MKTFYIVFVIPLCAVAVSVIVPYSVEEAFGLGYWWSSLIGWFNAILLAAGVVKIAECGGCK